MDQNNDLPRLGMIISKDDIENGFTADNGLNVINNGYKYLVLEVTVFNYDKVMILGKELLAKKVPFFIEFSANWYEAKSDYFMIHEMINKFHILVIFVRINEGTKINSDEVVTKLFDLYPVKIYYNNAFLDPTIEGTNICEIYKSSTRLLPQDSFSFAPILFDTQRTFPDEWVPRIFAKDNDFIKRLIVKCSLQEILFYPYKNISDSSVVAKIFPPTIETSMYQCVKDTFIREGPSVHSRIVEEVKIGMQWTVIKIVKENEYNVFGQITENAWIVLRHKGVNYFLPYPS